MGRFIFIAAASIVSTMLLMVFRETRYELAALLLLSLQVGMFTASVVPVAERFAVDKDKRPCEAPCSCGCGYLLSTIPTGDCNRECDCGCGRPCRVHRLHRGDHAW